MKLLRIILIILTTPLAHGSSMEIRLKALAEIETNNRDNPPGPDISRYGISKRVWREYTSQPYTDAKNSFTAMNIAIKILTDRLAGFQMSHHQPATDTEAYLLWYRMAHVDHPSNSELEKATRFSNLCASL